MKTVIRNSYTPELGDYCNKIVVDKETNTIYFFDTDGVYTEVDNTRVDVDAIVAEAVAEAGAYTDEVADTKVDKEEGKGLSSNDFTDEEKEKLESVEEGAQENVIEIIKRNGSALTVTDKTVDISVPTKTSDLTNDSGFVVNTVDDLVNYYTKTQTDSAIAAEATAREGADQNLQEQIDAIAAGSDVVDIVGTYAELQSYDTSKLHNNDIIKVLSDETRSGATTYYRWSTTAEDFSYIGSQGPFYTKSESDSTFVPQTRTVNGKALSSDITLSATDVGALPNSTVIPTVNDATLTIQKNGSTVTTFTANSATNTTANITVPTKTSDLTNDGADGTDTYVEAGDLAAVATSGAYADLTGKPSIPTKTSDLTNDSDFVSDANYVHTDNNFTTTLKNKLNGIAAGAEVNVQSDWAQTDNTADDYIKNKPSIPTKTSDLTNDSGFITSAALPTKLSDLTNDTGFITKSVSDLTNYYDQTTINNMFNALSVPTKTSDLVNDSGFITNTDYASASTGGVVKVGSGLSIDANGVLSSDGLTSVDWADVTNKPTNVSYWTNDAGYITSAALPTKTSDLTNDSGFITSAALPTKTSDLTNDSGFITSSVNNLTNYYTKGDTYTQSEVNSLLSAITIPTKTSDLTNDGADGTSTYVEASDLATVATTGSYNDLTDKPADFELVEMSYGESNAWAKFIDAYRGHKIVYCRASSNSNPATGTQGRKAFMAYVNNAENPTEVEFQYVRSVSSKTASQPVDQVFVYKLTNASGGTWSVQTRDMGPKLAQGTNTTVSYSNGTYTISATQPTVPTKTSDLTNDSGFLTSTDYATASTGGVIKVGGGLEITNGVLSATGGGTADAVEWANVLNKPTDVSYWTNDAGYITSAAIPSNVSAFSNDAGYLTSIPTASASTLGGVKVGSNLSIDANGVLSATQPTVGNATLTIQKNGTSAGTFTANATSNKTINITVPTTAADVSALPASTKYGASIAVSINTTDYKVTTTLKDQDGNTLGTAQVIDLPLESVVVNGSYDSTNKKIVLTLQNGNTVDIPVGDLIAGLQTEITSTNKLSSDLVDDTNHTHKFVTAAQITKLNGIAAGAEVNVQSDWDQTTTTADDYIKNKPTLATVATSGSYNDLSNKPTIPTVNNATLTIQKNGTTVKTFTANASTNVTANITVPTKTSDITNDSNFVASGDLAAVATSGSYNDLSNKPTIPAAQVQSDWTQATTTAVDYIKNKPTLATVATSGSYNDLSNKPTIPTVNNATLTIQKNGTNVSTFTANASSNVTANIVTDELQRKSDTRASMKPSDANYPAKATLHFSTVGAFDTQTQSGGYVDALLLNSWNNDSGGRVNALVATKQNDQKLYHYTGTFNGESWSGKKEIAYTDAIPTKTSDLTNDSDFVSDANYVHTDNNFTTTEKNKLSGIAAGAEVNVQANWTQTTTTADDYIKNKPTLATVATSGNYNDLSNKPTIPTVNNATLTIQKNSTNVATFTANASSNVTANISVPTKTSELTNDSDFTTTDVAQEFAIGQGSTNPVFDEMTPVKTIEWDVSDATYRPIYQMANTGWTYINMDITVAYRITVTGTNIHSVTDVVDRWINPTSYPITSMMCRTLSNAAATTGLRYLRAVYPVSGYLNNATYPLGTEIAMYNTTARHVKVEVFKDNSQVTWNTTKPSGPIYVSSTYNGNNAMTAYDTRGWRFRQPAQMYAQNAGYAGYMSDFEAVNTAAGDLKTGATALTAGHYAFLADDGLVYDISNTAKNIAMGESKVGFMNNNVNANTAISYTYWRAISRPNATQVGYIPHDTFALGNRVFLRCTMDSSGNVHSDNRLSTTMSAGYTWMPFGWARSATTLYVDTRFPKFYTLDSNGKLTHIDGKEIAAGMTSVAWGDITGKPTFATVATSGSYNDLSNKPTIPTVNNGTLTIQKNGTNIQTFTANQSGNATANITVPTAVSELNNDSGYQTAAQVQAALDDKQDALTAGDHIDITNDVISATGYVHSDDPVSTTSSTATVTGSMIANGTITADKLATGATLKLTLSTTDIGEGAALAANTLYGVYQ